MGANVTGIDQSPLPAEGKGVCSARLSVLSHLSDSRGGDAR